MTIHNATRDLYAETRAAILAAALPDIAFDGWTDAALDAAIASSGVDPHQAALAFPDGARDLAQYFVEAGDADMQTQLGQYETATMKIRERINQSVRLRLEVDAPHKEAVRRLVAYYANPLRQPQGAALLFQTADKIWRWAGDTSTDYNYYSKRMILSGVLASTRLVWLGDEAAGFEKSFAFLDRRIEDVMQFERVKGQARRRAEALSTRLPDPLDVLAQLRYGRG